MIKLLKSDIKLLKKLQTIIAVTGNEERMTSFLLDYIRKNKHKWKRKPKIIHGKKFGNMIILVFGKPRTAALAHMDEVGFMTAHDNKLLRLGHSKEKNKDKLYGFVNNKRVFATVIKKPRHISYRSQSNIPLGTILSYVSNWRESKNYITSPAIDNCAGILNLLYIARKLENGILVFTEREEGSNGGLGSIAKYIYEKCGVSQILISDITPTSTTVKHGKGAVIGVGIEELPDQQFLHKINTIATTYDLPTQAEIRKTGKSDFSRLAATPYIFDMCYLGVPVSNKHSSSEKMFKRDLEDMFAVYSELMARL